MIQQIYSKFETSGLNCILYENIRSIHFENPQETNMFYNLELYTFK